MAKELLFQIKDLHLEYRTQQGRFNIFEAFDLDFYQGDRLVILGASGSGKTTLSQLLMGLLPRNARITKGSLHLKDRVVDLSRKDAALYLGSQANFSMIFQDAKLALNPMRTIGQQFEDYLKFHQIVPAADMRDYSLELLRRFHLEPAADILKAYPHQLSGGMCQRVCIALCLAKDADLLIADEPTSALDVLNTQELIHTLKTLPQSNLLLITHSLEVARAVASRVVVLNKGRIVEDSQMADLMQQAQHPYSQSFVASYQALLEMRPPDSKDKASEILRIESLSKTFKSQGKILDQLNLSVNQGESLGILGQSSCGKSTLSRLIMGLERADQGAIYYQGQDLLQLKAKDRQRQTKDLQLVFQQARSSLNPKRTCLGSVEEALRHTSSLRGQARQKKALEWLEKVGISNELAFKYPAQLSTGQCQRVAIARALSTEPKLLIADEIVSALDQNIQAEILELLKGLTAELGSSLLMISHDLKVLTGLCHRMAVMDQGQIIAQGRLEDLRKNPHPQVQALIQASWQEE